MSNKRRVVWSAGPLRVLLVKTTPMATVVVEIDVSNGDGEPLWVEVHKDVGASLYDAAVRRCITALSETFPTSGGTESVLPMTLDDGTKFFCASMAGGAGSDVRIVMPKTVTIARRLPSGVETFATYKISSEVDTFGSGAR